MPETRRNIHFRVSQDLFERWQRMGLLHPGLRSRMMERATKQVVEILEQERDPMDFQITRGIHAPKKEGT